MSEELRKTICGFCANHCRITVKIRDGQLIGYEEDPQRKDLAPVVRACPRARAVKEWFYHPRRLNYPLKRVGDRGGNKWQQISWEQALDEIASKLDGIRTEYGAEALAITDGELITSLEYRARFQHLFGSPNQVSSGIVCSTPGVVVSTIIYGWPIQLARIHPKVTRCMLVIGANASHTFRPAYYTMLKALKNGAKLIVVDPRRTDLAARANLWLQAKPDTDTALLMSMTNVIINEQLYDKQFVDKWCFGFDQLAQRAQDYPPEKVAEITGLPAEKIIDAARMYATNKPAISFHLLGLEQQSNSIQSLQARYILPAITGNLDIPGGDLIEGLHPKFMPACEVELTDELSPEQKSKQIGADRFKLLSWSAFDLIQKNVKRVWGAQLDNAFLTLAHWPTLLRAIITDKPYPVRGWIITGMNPIMSYPNPKVIYQALKRLDLSVVMDLFLTPTCQLADYVLPAASWLERPMFNTYQDVYPGVDFGEAVFPPQYERKTEYYLWRELGMRLGQEQYWPWQTLEEAYDFRLAPMGYTFREFIDERGGSDHPHAEFKRHEKQGFATPTGKVELYSTILEQMGYDPLPRYEEHPKGSLIPQGSEKEYPLILINGLSREYYHSQQRQVDSIRNKYPDPLVQINPAKAAELDIKDGDWVWIETYLGRVQQRCQYFSGIDPSVVCAEYGWWFPEEPPGEPSLSGAWKSNINVVVNDAPELCHEVSGGFALRGLPCRVYPVRE